MMLYALWSIVGTYSQDISAFFELSMWQAEFFEGPFGASIAVDNRLFPDSMNQLLGNEGGHSKGCDLPNLPSLPKASILFTVISCHFILFAGLKINQRYYEYYDIIHPLYFFTYARRMPSIFGCGLSGRGKNCDAYLGFFRRMATTSKSSLRRPGKSVTATTESFCQGILCR